MSNWQDVADWWASVTWVEIFGTLTGLSCVWLYGRNNMWAWPTGIANALLFMFMFFDAKLYSDVVLQTVFLALSIHGWYAWLRGGPKRARLSISSGLSAAHATCLALSTAFVAVSAGSYFSRFTDAALPYWDASILALSLAAQWLLNRKHLESWLVWLLVDMLAVGVYAYRGLLLTALLYGVFFALALNGFFAWRNELRVAASATEEVPA